MSIRVSRSQFTWSPVVGWVLLSCVVSTAQAQVDTPSPAKQTLEQQTPQVDLPQVPDTSADAVPRSADELGVAVGAFTLYPILDIYAGYDNNVYATSTSPSASAVTVVKPTLELRSEWLNHSLRLLAGGGFGFYPSATTQNFQNYVLQADGKLDIRQDVYMTGLVAIKRNTEALGTPNVSFAQAPTVVDTVPVELGFYQRFNRFFYQLNGSATRYWYYDYSTITALGLPAASRNRTEYAESIRLGYEILEGIDIFLAPSFNQRVYVDTVNTAGQQRDSRGYNLGFGGSMNLGSRTALEAMVGYTTQNYLADGTSTTATTFQLAGRWNGYEPLTLRPAINRSINESALTNYTNYVSTVVGIDWTYDVHYPWKAIGGLSYNTADYTPVPGTGTAPRTDYFFKGSLGALYEVRPQYSIGPVYEYTQGWSTDVLAGGPQFNRSLFSIRLVMRR